LFHARRRELEPLKKAGIARFQSRIQAFVINNPSLLSVELSAVKKRVFSNTINTFRTLVAVIFYPVNPKNIESLLHLELSQFRNSGTVWVGTVAAKPKTRLFKAVKPE
jgi:uncharacterized membrane protein